MTKVNKQIKIMIKMKGILSVLNDPQYVVRFQKFCGIESLSDEHTAKHSDLGSHKDSNGVERSNDVRLRNSHSSDINGVNHSSTIKPIPYTIHNDGNTRYIVHNKLLYYLFHFGAALGNEIFYMTFFPFWFWNIDGYVGRRICLFWCIFMYLGQGMKDVLKLPRPAAPPVIRVERQYELEYGMPSTHAMVGAGMPFSIYFLTVERYNSPGKGLLIGKKCSEIKYDSHWMLIGAVLWCTLVCCSRLYLGMHSILDIVAGLLFVFLLMIVCFPLLDTIDNFILHSPWSPLVCVIVPVLLVFLYPTPDRWSTARGDTTLILAVGSGIAIGHWVSYRYGVMTKASTPPPYDIIEPTWRWAGLVVIRMLIGVLFVVCLRAALKRIASGVVHFVVSLCGAEREHKASEPDRRAFVELPIKFITYSLLSAISLHVVPEIFRKFNIERETFFTEI